MAKAKVAVKVSVEIPTLIGSQVVEVELVGHEKRLAKNPELLLALAAVKVPDVVQIGKIKTLDAVVKRAYKRSKIIRRLVDMKAREKVNGDEELARAYISAWLRSEERELPDDDPDAGKVAEQYYKLVWKFGYKYVVQVAPWE